MTELVVYLLIGRLVVFSLQKFPFQKLFPKLFVEGKFLKQLFGCDFCLGFWVYWTLAFVFEMNFLYEYFYVLMISEFLTGLVASFVMQLLVVGWKDLYSTVYLE